MNNTITPMPTGALRAALQPVVFLHLLASVPTTDGRKAAFGSGQMVAAQYWGSGLVSLTSTTGEYLMVVAHDIKARLATPPAATQVTSE